MRRQATKKPRPAGQFRDTRELDLASGGQQLTSATNSPGGVDSYPEFDALRAQRPLLFRAVAVFLHDADFSVRNAALASFAAWSWRLSAWLASVGQF